MAGLRVLVGAILAAALVLAFAAPASAHGGRTARVRAFHASPDTPAVDVQVRLAGRWYRIVRGLEVGETGGSLLLPAWT